MTLPFATVFFLLRRICCLAVDILALHNRHATLLPIYLLAASTSRLHLKMHGGESCADLNHLNHFFLYPEDRWPNRGLNRIQGPLYPYYQIVKMALIALYGRFVSFIVSVLTEWPVSWFYCRLGYLPNTGQGCALS